MSEKIINAFGGLPKVCEHINLPEQAGNDTRLEKMRRPYTQNDYRELGYKIRDKVPGVSITTDIIVGFRYSGFSETPPNKEKLDHYCGDSVYVGTTAKYSNDKELELKRHNVLKEIDYAVGKWGIRYIDMVDDVFGIDHRWIEEFCTKLIERKHNVIIFDLKEPIP